MPAAFFIFTAQLFHRRKSSRLGASQTGMTLIEIMVVLAIIGAFIMIGPARLMNKGTEFKNELQKMQLMARTLRSKARIHNTTYRLVLFMPGEKDPNPRHRFWVESTAKNATVSYSKDVKMTSPLIEAEKNRNKKKEDIPPDTSGFQVDQMVMKKPTELPKGYKFSSVENMQREQPITSEVAFVHFFPSGLVEETALHISGGEKMHWTIYFPAMTGAVEILDGETPLRDLRPQ